MQRQRHQPVERMLEELPLGCDIGAKRNSKGNEEYWRGYKLHLRGGRANPHHRVAPDDLWSQIRIEFYKDEADAVFKALVE